MSSSPNTKAGNANRNRDESCCDKFRDRVREFFKAHPLVNSITWSQFTSGLSFNECCCFAVDFADLMVNGIPVYDKTVECDKPLEDCGDDFLRSLNDFNDYDLKDIFGPGIITLNADGRVQVETAN